MLRSATDDSPHGSGYYAHCAPFGRAVRLDEIWSEGKLAGVFGQFESHCAGSGEMDR
jgi:hypothetical protein